MSLIGLYRKLRKKLLRLPFLISVMWDFNTRWRPQMIESRTSFRHFLKTGMREAVREHRYDLEVRERTRIMQERWVRVPIVTWLPTPENPHLPYLCPRCGADGEHVDQHTLRFETVRFASPQGTLSWIQLLVLHCTTCGEDTVEDEHLVRRGIVFPHSPERNPRRVGKRVYHLSYDVSYGPTYSRNRRQVRERGTHKLVECRAEVVSMDEGTADLSAQCITNIMVDDHTLLPTHPLFPAVAKVIAEYEEKLM